MVSDTGARRAEDEEARRRSGFKRWMVAVCASLVLSGVAVGMVVGYQFGENAGVVMAVEWYVLKQGEGAAMAVFGVEEEDGRLRLTWDALREGGEINWAQYLVSWAVVLGTAGALYLAIWRRAPRPRR